MPSRARGAFVLLVLLTAANAAYLAAFDSATIFYHVNVLAHVVLGLVLVAALVFGAGRRFSGRAPAAAAGPAWLARGIYPAAALVMSATGLFLTKVGTSRPYYPWLRVHEAGAFVFVRALAAALAIVQAPARRRILAALALLALFPAAVRI